MWIKYIIRNVIYTSRTLLSFLIYNVASDIVKVSGQHVLINNKFYLFFLLYFLFPNKFHSFAMFQLPSSLYAAWVRGTYIYLRKDVYYVFVFDASKLRNFWTVVKEQSNGRCLRGMLYILSTPLLCQHKVYFVVIHIGVGYLGVARSNYCGQCEGLEARDE